MSAYIFPLHMLDSHINTFNPPSPPSAFFKKILLILVGTFCFIAILMAILWYTDKENRQNKLPTSSSSPTPFNPTQQVIPKGAESREVDQSLAAFGFSKPLPFFEKNNVVQSLNVTTSAPTSTTDFSVSPVSKVKTARRVNTANTSSRTPPPQNSPTTFLSYRIFGKSREMVQNAFIEYFKNMGWNIEKSQEGQPLVFSSEAHQFVYVAFLDAPAIQNTDQPTIVAALTVR